jgi:hypothetical protein
MVSWFGKAIISSLPRESKRMLRDKLIELRLKSYFKTHPPDSEIYTSYGDISLFDAEIRVLKDSLGWTEKKESNLSVTCLLVSVIDCNIKVIENALAIQSDSQLILLQTLLCNKTTPLYAKLEQCGYRMLFEIDSVVYFSKARLNLSIISKNRSLDDLKIQKILKKSWRQISKLPRTTETELVSAHPSELLTPNRFDIAIKCLYGRLWVERRGKSWRNYAYYEQALRITGPGKNIREFDGTGKHGVEQFKAGFKSLLTKLDPNDIPVVPVDRSLVAFDGAHRVASACVIGRSVNAARINVQSNVLASAEFFQGISHGHPPCPKEILDEAAIEYCRIKEGMVLVLIFPTVTSEQFTFEKLSELGTVVYKKKIELTPDAGAALLRQIYLGQPWLNEQGESSGFTHKVKSCFPFPGTLNAILLDNCNSKKIRSTKELIRTYYDVGNHSIHITDGEEEVLMAAQILFNDNSINLLRIGGNYLPGFHSMLFRYRNWLEQSGLNRESFCVDGSACLALLGLRECRDIDFLYHGDIKLLQDLPEKIECHNSQQELYSHVISDIVSDPRLHCWYMGVKFCIPSLILEMKQRRNETKDRVDVALLRSRLPKDRPHWMNILMIRIRRIEFYLQGEAMRNFQKIKKLLKLLLNKKIKL